MFERHRHSWAPPRRWRTGRPAAFGLGLVISVLPGLALSDHPVTTLGGSAAGSINTPSALSMPQGMVGVQFLVQAIEFDALSDEEILASEGSHSTDRVISPSLSITYGLVPDLMIGANFPFIQRQNFRQASVHAHGAGGEEEEGGHAHENPGGHVQGVGNYGELGDATVYAQYTLKNTGRHALAGLLGVKLPTGDTDVEHEGELLDTNHQPGSGSTDPMIGVTYSHRAGDLALDAATSYIFTTEGDQNFELGDVLNYNLSLARRFSAAAHDDAAGHAGHLHWDLVGEINGEYRGDQKFDGTTLQQTAAHVIYVSPGVRLAFPGGLNAVFSLGVPVFTEIQEVDAEPELRGLGGVSYAW